MARKYLWILALVLLLFFVQGGTANSQDASPLLACQDFAFSTEEDFITQGPTPFDGNVYISDGDLLARNHAVCLRNAALLAPWKETVDLGLDAVDILNVDSNLVAFSTELNDPAKRFTAGDLLTTSGIVIPNHALLLIFQVQGDRGLDALQFMGETRSILTFIETIGPISRDEWLRKPDMLIEYLNRYNIDIWFSIEGTVRANTSSAIYDGDLLSARGVIVSRNSDLLPPAVPAGIPSRGVDFGLDAFAAPRTLKYEQGWFSTEILYRDEVKFNDGDILKTGDGVSITARDLYAPFEPAADFLGTDALYIRMGEIEEHPKFLPDIRKLFGLTKP